MKTERRHLVRGTAVSAVLTFWNTLWGCTSAEPFYPLPVQRYEEKPVCARKILCSTTCFAKKMAPTGAIITKEVFYKRLCMFRCIHVLTT